MLEEQLGIAVVRRRRMAQVGQETLDVVVQEQQRGRAAGRLGATLGGGGGVAAGALGKAGQSTNFRNVSACNRCRLRKNRCDQKLPSCASCMKAKVPCVGYDPTTKKEIPRRLVAKQQLKARDRC